MHLLHEIMIILESVSDFVGSRVAQEGMSSCMYCSLYYGRFVFGAAKVLVQIASPQLQLCRCLHGTGGSQFQDAFKALKS